VVIDSFGVKLPQPENQRFSCRAWYTRTACRMVACAA
jgi:hypothetical protein